MQKYTEAWHALGDRTSSRTGPVPPLSDPVWNIADVGLDQTISTAALSLFHAREWLLLAVAYDFLRVPDSEQARRIRRALQLVESALDSIG